MPHRVNTKGDLGNTKIASDSYDIDNIYLTEEGWVYRHFKNVEQSKWWDEIIVAGQVVPNKVIHTVDNGRLATSGNIGDDVVISTNPPKLGVVTDVPYESGDDDFDYEYSDHEGDLP